MLQVCETFLEDCEDGFHGRKDIPNVPALRHNSQYAGDDLSDGVTAAASRRLRGYLPSKRRISVPVQKCVSYCTGWSTVIRAFVFRILLSCPSLSVGQVV